MACFNPWIIFRCTYPKLGRLLQFHWTGGSSLCSLPEGQQAIAGIKRNGMKIKPQKLRVLFLSIGLGLMAHVSAQEIEMFEGLNGTESPVFEIGPGVGPGAMPVSEFDVIEKVMNDMFDFELYDIGLPTGIQDNPPPPVPLDGGLTALLLAGGAAGYRVLRKKKEA